jgi:hypothetical protein
MIEIAVLAALNLHLISCVASDIFTCVYWLVVFRFVS